MLILLSAAVLLALLAVLFWALSAGLGRLWALLVRYILGIG